MYLTHTEESQRMNSIETVTGRLYKQRTDELAKWKEKISINFTGSIPLFCINTYNNKSKHKSNKWTKIILKIMK